MSCTVFLQVSFYHTQVQQLLKAQIHICLYTPFCATLASPPIMSAMIVLDLASFRMLTEYENRSTSSVRSFLQTYAVY